MMGLQALADATAQDLSLPIRVGFDLVQVSQVAQSLEQFGQPYEARLFTHDERAYAHAGAGMAAQRLAARFAAKEAVIKALRLGQAGLGWRDIEVRRGADGTCGIALHGRAAALAARQGVGSISLCLSHDGDYAGAVAIVSFAQLQQEEDRRP